MGYSVHVFFHLLAMIFGAVCGIGAGLWWYGHFEPGLWIAVTALGIGIIVLVVQAAYIREGQPRRTRAHPSPSPGFQPATGQQPPHTLVQRTSAFDDRWEQSSR